MKFKIGDKVTYREEETVIVAIRSDFEHYVIEYSMGWEPNGLEGLAEGKLEKEKTTPEEKMPWEFDHQGSFNYLSDH